MARLGRSQPVHPIILSGLAAVTTTTNISCSVTMTPSLSMTRRVGKVLSISETPTLGLSALRAVSVLIQVSMTPTISLTKSIGKVINVFVSPIISLIANYIRPTVIALVSDPYYTVSIPIQATTPQWPNFSSMIAGASEQTLTWDFSVLVPPEQSLQGTPIVTLTPVVGTDDDAQSNIKAGPMIGTANITQTLQGSKNCAVLAQLGPFPVGAPGTTVRYRCNVKCPVTPSSIGASDIAAGFNYLDVITP